MRITTYLLLSFLLLGKISAAQNSGQSSVISRGYRVNLLDRLTEDKRQDLFKSWWEVFTYGKVKKGRPAVNETARISGMQGIASLACDTLQTGLTGTNGNDGIMFDISALHDVTITQFAAHINPVSSGYVKIYYKTWTCTQGYDTIPSAWTFIDSAMVTSAGSGVATIIPINVNVMIPAGGTSAFYITGTGAPSLMYSNGTAVGAVSASDTMIQVKQGIGKSYPFGNSYSPRAFNGQVLYCEAVVGVEEAEQQANSFTLQPNPFSDHATISFSKAVDNAQVHIYDMLGKEVKQFTAVNTDRIEVISEGLKSGIYFISVIENGKAAGVKKMIVQ